ncbi:MAG: mandelate racemase/muconate lactonizing enzyme family protein [Planctomycetota bacterium]|nr:MAG: mandelate racemase/muconate lactonizing enzyme family protein [Planctomycetota bacterium]
MQITDVRAVQPHCEGSPPDWRTSLGQILVAVDTDCGVTGYGVGGGGAAGIHVVRSVLRDLLLGTELEPARGLGDLDVLWERMYSATLPFGQKGLAIMALSGVDLALWDLWGKALRRPVFGLLGSPRTLRVPAYATVWDDVRPARDAGFQAVKLHLAGVRGPQDRARIAASVAGARKLLGPQCALMLDAWMQWDVETTLAVADDVAATNIEWIEEPLPADDHAGYRALRDRSPVAIAGGEHEFTDRGFSPLIQQRLHTVLQPDITWCGGMTALRRIYRMAHDAQLRVCPHRGAEIWSLHALVTLDLQPLAEQGRPWMQWIPGQPAIIDGYVEVPEDVHGFGVRIDESRLKTIA